MTVRRQRQVPPIMLMRHPAGAVRSCSLEPVAPCSHNIAPKGRTTWVRLGYGCLAVLGSLAVGSVSVGTATSPARPCYRHTGDAKKACVKAKHERDARDRMAWPPSPSAAEIRRRVGDYNWFKARRVAVCETGFRVRWYLTADGTPTGQFVSALGMYVRTFEYGVRATGYRGRTWPEQVAIAVAAHPITGGWSGWGCGGA